MDELEKEIEELLEKEKKNTAKTHESARLNILRLCQEAGGIGPGSNFASPDNTRADKYKADEYAKESEKPAYGG